MLAAQLFQFRVDVQEFAPPPEESRAIIRQGVCAPSPLLCSLLWSVAHPGHALQLAGPPFGKNLLLRFAQNLPLPATKQARPLSPPAGYTVPRNLLLRFAQDEIDETPQLASTLQSSGVCGAGGAVCQNRRSLV